MYKRLWIFLVLCATLSANVFADSTVVINPVPEGQSSTAANCIGAPIGNIDSGSVTYKAEYTPKKFKISYDCGGTKTSANAAVGKDDSAASTSNVTGNAPGDVTVAFDSEWRLEIEPGDCKLEGHSFAGWSCNYDIATGVENPNADKLNYLLGINGVGEPIIVNGHGDKYKVDDDVLCTAIWVPGKYNVIYEKGTHGMGADDIDTNGATYGKDYTVKYLADTGITAETGYHFTNWRGPKFDNTDGNKDYAENASETYKRKQSTTLTAQWTENRGQIVYSCGSVSGDKELTRNDVQTGLSGYSLLTDVINCESAGKTFIGWSCDYKIENGANSGETYNYNVEYNNFGFVAGSNNAVTIPEKVVVPSNGGVIKCQAVWSDDTYVVIYTHGDHGTGDDYETVALNYNVLHTVLANGVEDGPNFVPEEGYTFDYWKCNARPEAGGSVSADGWYKYIAGGKFRVVKQTVCEAVWKPIEYYYEYQLWLQKSDGTLTQVTSYAQGVSPLPPQGSQVYTVETSFELSTPSRDGYEFGGWKIPGEDGAVADSFNGASYVDASYTQNNPLIIYGKLTENSYGVVYKACVDDDCTDDGAINLTNMFASDTIAAGYTTFTHDTVVTFPTVNTVFKSDVQNTYRFVKNANNEIRWYTTPQEYGTYRVNTQDWGGNATVWTELKKLYNLTYICGTGAEGEAPAGDKYVYGETVTLKANNTCAKADSQFTGWDCSVSGVDNMAPNKTFVMPKNDVTCTAHFEANKYSLEYDCSIDGSLNTTSYVSGGMHDENENVTLSNYVAVCGANSNYASVEWSCGAKVGDGTVSVTNNQITMPKYNVVCKASGTPNAYTLTYNCNEGRLKTDGNAEESDPESYTYPNYTAQLKAQDFCVKPGSTFTKWRCNNVLRDALSSMTLTANTVCEAQWNDSKFKVEYDCGTGSGTVPATKRYSFGENLVVATNTCTNVGAGFNMWKCYIDDNGEATDKAPADTFTMPAHDVTCVADWNENAYNIIYHNVDEVDAGWEGANADLHPTSYVYGTGASIGVPSRNNYRFLGWCIGENNAGCTSYAAYANGYTISTTQTGTVHLHAVWQAEEYPITYVLRIKKLNEALREVRSTDRVTMPKNPSNITSYNVTTEPQELRDPSKEHYEFGGWYLDERETAPVLIVPSSKGSTGSITLYGTLTEVDYDLTYKACVNGNCANAAVLTDSLPDGYKKFSYDYVVYFPTNNSVFSENIQSGYRFVKDSNDNIKWYTNSQDNGTYRVNTQGWESNMTVWTHVKTLHDVVYTCGEGGSGNAPASERYVWDEVATVVQNSNCVKSGYEFAGWSCNGTHRDAGDEFTVRDDVTCDAEWDANGHTVTYLPGDHGQFESGHTSTVVVVDYGETHTLLDLGAAYIVPNTGYVYDAWDCRYGNVLIDADQPSDTFAMPDADVVCTADWDPKKYNVIYNKGDYAADGVVNYPDNQGAEYDKNYVALMGGTEDSATGIYAATGYTFKGWNKEQHSATGNWTGEKPWQIDGSLTVYAAYEPNTYKIRYICGAQGVVPTLAEQSVLFNEQYELADADNCVVPGQTFVGWDCPDLTVTPNVSNGEQMVWFAAKTSGTYDMNDNVVCTARWRPTEYHVTYDCGTGASGNAPVDEEQPYSYNDSVVVKGNTVVVDEEETDLCVYGNYDFVGWNCGDNDVVYNQGDTFYITEDTECVAQWDRKCCAGDKYLNTESGKCETCPLAHSHVVVGTCPESCECDTGYEMKNGECVAIRYNITYDHNGDGADFEPDANVMDHYYVYTENQAVPNSVRSGYVFKGWEFVVPEGHEFENPNTPELPGDYFRANPMNITLRAQWEPEGEIRYFCSREPQFVNTYNRKTGVIGAEATTHTGDSVCSCVGSRACTFINWECDDGEEYAEEAPIIIPATLKKCYAKLSVPVEYRVYTVDEEDAVEDQLSVVKVGDDLKSVSSLEPKNIQTLQTPISYPEISWDGYTFVGWYKKKTGNQFIDRVYETPQHPTEKVIVYGKLVKNPEVEQCTTNSYLHINDEKMCLYKEPPAQKPYLVVQKDGVKYYGIMTKRTSTSDFPITNGSTKKMHIKQGNTVYNVHDKSSR